MMKNIALLGIACIVLTGFSGPSVDRSDRVIDQLVDEVNQVLVHYRAWLESPAVLHVVKGTNHAARATVLIDQELNRLAQMNVEEAGGEQRVGLKSIQSVLLKQMRIHVDMLSTNVPVGIVSYDVDVENAVEEQLDLLEQTLREFERHQAGG